MVCGIARPALHNAATATSYMINMSSRRDQARASLGGFVVTTAPHHSSWSLRKLSFPNTQHYHMPYIHVSMVFVGAGDDSGGDNGVPTFRTSRPTAARPRLEPVL